jgi:hypothetical protein
MIWYHGISAIVFILKRTMYTKQIKCYHVTLDFDILMENHSLSTINQ